MTAINESAPTSRGNGSEGNDSTPTVKKENVMSSIAEPTRNGHPTWGPTWALPELGTRVRVTRDWAELYTAFGTPADDNVPQRGDLATVVRRPGHDQPWDVSFTLDRTGETWTGLPDTIEALETASEPIGEFNYLIVRGEVRHERLDDETSLITLRGERLAGVLADFDLTMSPDEARDLASRLLQASTLA